MKTLKMKQLDLRDEEIANALISLGMSRPVSKAMSLPRLSLRGGTGLRQPEVSIARDKKLS